MQYTITNVNRRNEWTGRDGATMVDWAIAVEGESGWIKLTQKLDTKPPEIGQTINGSIEDKTDRNGNPYRKFKKEYSQKSGGGLSDEDRKQLDYAVQMLEELTGRRDPDAREAVDSSNILEDLGDPFPNL